MNPIVQGVLIAISAALAIGVVKLYREFIELKTSVRPVLMWYEKTSLDALKIATNPTSQRLTELANKYRDTVIGKGNITVAEKQELIKGLLDIFNDQEQVAGKRQSASVSLRFIEARERLALLPNTQQVDH